MTINIVLNDISFIAITGITSSGGGYRHKDIPLSCLAAKALLM